MKSILLEELTNELSQFVIAVLCQRVCQLYQQIVWRLIFLMFWVYVIWAFLVILLWCWQGRVQDEVFLRKKLFSMEKEQWCNFLFMSVYTFLMFRCCIVLRAILWCKLGQLHCLRCMLDADRSRFFATFYLLWRAVWLSSLLLWICLILCASLQYWNLWTLQSTVICWFITLHKWSL